MSFDTATNTVVFTADCRHCDRRVVQPAATSGKDKVRWIRCKRCKTAHHATKTSLTDVDSDTLKRVNELFDVELGKTLTGGSDE